MKKLFKTVFIMIMIVLSCLFVANAASNDTKYEYHNSSWYLSKDEATAFMGFIYNLAPEDLDKKEFANTAIDLLSGKYADNPEDEHIIKMVFCEVALTQMNSMVEKYDHASVITSTNLINWLKDQIGDNAEEDQINSICNSCLDKVKNSLKKTLLLCNLSTGEYEVFEKIESYVSGYKTIIGIPQKAKKYADAIKSGLEAIIYTGASSRSAMYKYFLEYSRTRDLANSTITGFEIAMSYNIVALVNQGLYDPFLNWAAEDNQKVLNRWAELFYWLMKDIGEVEFTNDYTSGTTSSTLEPVAFVPGTGIYEGRCGEKVKWHLDASTGILNIYGEGSMDNYASASKTPWYSYRQYINYIRVTDGVTSIGNYAFAECITLDKVYLAADVYNIGNYAFYNCVAMRLFVVDGIVNNIGQYAFAHCKSIVYFDIPDKVTNISVGLFSGCVNLVTVDIAENVEKIGQSAFNGCTSLESISLSTGTKIIDNYAFSECKSLKAVDLSSNLEKIGVHAFQNCTSLTEIVVPDSVTTIESYAFYGVNNLQSITLPFVGKTADSSDSTGVFGHIFGWSTSSLSSGTIQQYSGSSSYFYFIPTSLRSVTITKDTDIPYGAFYNCSFLTEINIPDTVTSIGNYAFEKCSGISEINIPEGVTIISYGAFEYCSNLAEINLPSTIITIDYYAFYRCENIKNLVLPVATTSIGQSAFNGCTSLESISLSTGTKIIDNYAFSECKSLKTVDLSSNLEKIGVHAFQNCTSLTEIVVPDSVTTIGSHAFYGVNNLQSITLPFVGENADSSDYKGVFGYIFGYSTSSLSPGTIIQASGSSSYYYFIPTSLRSVTITKDTDIPYGAFYNCSFLTEINIPDTVTSIGNYAFYNCSKLSELIILNKNCSIYNSSGTIYSTIIIKAPCGSLAQEYAQKYNRNFISIKHNLTDWFADFEIDGNTMTTNVYRKCSICDEVVDLTTHKTNGWIVDSEPSCEVEGSKHIECIDCGNRYDAVIPTNSHIEIVDEAIPATCTSTGLTEGKHCYVCNTVIVEQEVIDTLGHDMGNWSETKTATCTQVGEKRKNCSRCDYYEVDNISMLPHTEVIDKAVAATCTTTGLTEGKHCSLCNSVIIEQEIINVTNHNYKDGICTMCGSKQTEGCNCNCHKSGITSLFFKLILFFQKIFKSNKLCKCGISHY